MNNFFFRRFNKRSDVILFTFALLTALFLQGAIPFILTPTLGQAVWITGFAKSFLNESVFSIYAQNIGAPEPAAIAFGLSGAWPSAVFMKLGLAAPDAYSAIIAIWLSVAFFSAYGIARHFSVNARLSILAAFCWLTMPVIWTHAGYSMLSTGIALIPCYLLFSIKIFSWNMDEGTLNSHNYRFWFVLYPAVCIISVFMDGYSFMMFSVGAGILGAWMFVSGNRDIKKRLAFYSFPTHLAGLGIAYGLYTIYIGKPYFPPAHINSFRGWGIDLTFLLIPTKGIHWLPDLIGWSMTRSSNRFFGDASVWNTSFSIPLVISAIWAVCNVPRKKGLVTGFVLVALFGFYMSMGPSIKINSVKPEGQKVGSSMSEEYALAPTGSAILSNNIPGFRNMRASYRWGALGVFGAWCLLVSAMSSKNKRKMVMAAACLLVIIALFNLPNLPKKIKNDAHFRAMFFQLESALIDDLRGFVHQGEKVAFLPWRNDFLVNYIASSLNIVSYNIGGDKNLQEARKHWPSIMRQFPYACVDDVFTNRVLLLYAKKEADVVIFPYIDMLWAAHRWPYPVKFREEIAPVIEQLNTLGFFEIVDHEFYAVVRLKPQYVNTVANELEKVVYQSKR